MDYLEGQSSISITVFHCEHVLFRCLHICIHRQAFLFKDNVLFLCVSKDVNKYANVWVNVHILHNCKFRMYFVTF